MVLEWKPKGKPKIKAFKEFALKDGTIIKYKDKYTKSVVRTPKHIHWVIDLLIKKEHNERLTLEFVDYLIDMYDKIAPFKTKAEQQKCELKFTNPENIKKFEELDKYGQYSIEFIGHVIELLSIEEKTGFEGAFMFKGVLTALKNQKDIFSIVSSATHNGRI